MNSVCNARCASQTECADCITQMIVDFLGISLDFITHNTKLAPKNWDWVTNFLRNCSETFPFLGLCVLWFPKFRQISRPELLAEKPPKKSPTSLPRLCRDKTSLHEALRYRITSHYLHRDVGMKGKVYQRHSEGLELHLHKRLLRVGICIRWPLFPTVHQLCLHVCNPCETCLVAMSYRSIQNYYPRRIIFFRIN